MGAFGVGVFESDVRGDVEELLEEGGKPAVVKAETVPAVSPKASSSKLRFPPDRGGLAATRRPGRASRWSARN